MMGGGFGNQSHPSSSSTTNKKQHRGQGGWFSGSFKPENLIPGIVIGFIFGLFSSKLNPIINNNNNNNNNTRRKRRSILSSNTLHDDDDLKMVLVVRQDLKMGQGKIASQCAHAATGLYAELMQRNKLQETAEGIGLPTYVVADAGRTQVSAGSKTVLAIGPGYKSIVDSVTGKQHLL